MNAGNGSKHRGATAEDMWRRAVLMQAETTAKVGPVSTRISENHVVGDRDDVKPSIGGDPGRSPSMVAEKVCGVIRKKSHDRTFFIDVFAIRGNALG